MKKIFTLLLMSTLSVFALDAQTHDQIFMDYLKSEFKNFDRKLKKNDGVFIDSKIVSIIIDSNGEVVEGTGLPTVLNESDQYRYRVILLTDQDDDANYEFKIDGKEYNPLNDFAIFNPTEAKTDEVAGLVEDPTDYVKMLSSDTSTIFSDKVFFEVKKDGKIIFKWEIKLIGASRYHVAIMGGYFHSTLNNPTNIIKVPRFGGADSTLVGDFTNHQRKLSVMAVFYPWERRSDYQWKKLKWYEALSLGFGIGLDEDLFDDLFAGINLEFAKGGYLSGGIHCGKHNVLAINPNFDFGSAAWNQTFDNSLITEEWDWGYYVGLIIDFRVITSMIGTRDKLNNSGSSDN